MTLFTIFIGISIAVISLVVYSALVVSGKQERLAQRVRDENRFERSPFSSYSADHFAFEVSEELTNEDEKDEFDPSQDEFF